MIQNLEKGGFHHNKKRCGGPKSSMIQKLKKGIFIMIKKDLVNPEIRYAT